jgi:hypothetical protein
LSSFASPGICRPRFPPLLFKGQTKPFFRVWEDEPVETTSACPDATSTAVGSPFCQMNGFALAYELATDNAADLAALLLSASATDYVSVSDSSADGVETATKLSSLSSYRQESSPPKLFFLEMPPQPIFSEAFFPITSL